MPCAPPVTHCQLYTSCQCLVSATQQVSGSSAQEHTWEQMNKCNCKCLACWECICKHRAKKAGSYRAYAAWTNGNTTGLLLINNKVEFPSFANRRLVNKMKATHPAGDLRRLTESCLCKMIVVIIVVINAITWYPVEEWIAQSLPVSLILCAINTSEHVKCIEEYIRV